MSDFGISIIGSPNKYWTSTINREGKWPLENILAPNTLYKYIKKSLKKENLLYLDQLIYNDKLITWSNYTTHTRSTNKGKIPTWFKLIEERTINKQREIINTNWILTTPNPPFKKYTQWKPKQHMIKTIMPEFDDLLDYNEIAIHIPNLLRQQWNNSKRQLQSSRKHSIFTDGSIQNTNTDLLSSGSAWITLLHDIEFSFPISKQKISTTAEGFAILSALEAIPQRSNIKIYTDSQAAISILSKWTTQPEKVSNREILKTTAWQVWHNITQVIKEKNITIALRKIKAHSGIITNELVDKLAKKAALSKSEPITVITPQSSHLQFSAYYHNTPINSNLRQFIKQQSKNR